MDDAPAAESLICPYCGTRQSPALECRACRGRFDAWSLSATQDDMGAWFLRDSRQPHFVGYSQRAIAAAIRAKEIDRDAVVRGPTTRQLWTLARRAPGLAHLFGRCFACQAPVTEASPTCQACGATPPAAAERNFLGLPPIARAVPPAGARADLSAFIEDSGILLARAEPVACPAEQPSRAPEARDASAVVATVQAGLAARARSLERTNRLLFGFAVISFLVAIGLVIVLVGIRERGRAETDARVAEAIRSMRAEFERRTPVVVPPRAELPAMPQPQPPAAGEGGGVAVPDTPAVP